MLEWIDDRRCFLDGVSFELRDFGEGHTTVDPASFLLEKPRSLVERYVALRERFAKANVLELGNRRGGSTAFLALLLRLRKLVSVDLTPVVPPELTAFLARTPFGDSVRPYGAVDQADRRRLEAILAQELGDEPLDLVIDDASHELGPTRESFHVLFPRLRPGGLFVLEDWSADHSLERAIERSPEALARIAADPHPTPPPTPMSRLLLEIVLAAGSERDVFPHLEIVQRWAGVERGPATLDPASFDVASCLGHLARRILGEA